MNIIIGYLTNTINTPPPPPKFILLQLDTCCYHSLCSRRLEVVGEREKGHARGRHARGEVAPARKAPENRFNSHSVSTNISNW